LKLYLIALALLLSIAGMSDAEDLERPWEAGTQDGALPAWEFPPPQYPARLPVESVGEALGVLKPAPMKIQLLSGPSILPLGLLLLGLGAGRLLAREG
jgi:hypothetical protein